MFSTHLLTIIEVSMFENARNVAIFDYPPSPHTPNALSQLLDRNTAQTSTLPAPTRESNLLHLLLARSLTIIEVTMFDRARNVVCRNSTFAMIQGNWAPICSWEEISTNMGNEDGKSSLTPMYVFAADLSRDNARLWRRLRDDRG
jgi:hypothetical protein